MFTFIPSLIWVPLSWREIKDITVPIELVLSNGIQFVHTEAIEVDPETKVLKTTDGDMTFDHLVIATGPKVVDDIAEGVQEHYIGTPAGAMKTRKALDELKKNPGPVVIGATQYEGFIGAGYEFLFNLEKWLREEGIRDRVELYWITPNGYNSWSMHNRCWKKRGNHCYQAYF